MTCKGWCTPYKAKKPITGRRYDTQKRCQCCEIYMETTDIFCLCCGYKLRTKPRNNKAKRAHNETRIKQVQSPPQIVLTI